MSYWDGRLKAGASLKEQLRKAITKCDVCIFIATKNSVVSQWCLCEVGAFWGAGKRIILYAAHHDIENELPPLFKGDFWTDDAREVINQVKEELEGIREKVDTKSVADELNSSAQKGVDYVDRALRSATTYPVLQELQKHIEELQSIAYAPDYNGESAHSLSSQINHLTGQMGGLWRLSQTDMGSHMLLKDIEADLDSLRRKLRADEELKSYKKKLLKLVSGDERLLHLLLEAFGGSNGVLREAGTTLKKVFQDEQGRQIARVEKILADAGYKTELSTDEEHGLWEIETIAVSGSRVVIGWDNTGQIEFQRAVKIYLNL